MNKLRSRVTGLGLAVTAVSATCSQWVLTTRRRNRRLTGRRADRRIHPEPGLPRDPHCRPRP